MEFYSHKIILGLSLAVCWLGLGCISAQERATDHVQEADRMAQLDRFDDAELELKEALAADPGHYDALMGLAALELRQDRLEEAAKHYEAAARARPDVALARYNLAVVRQRQKSWAEALRAYEDVLRLLPHYEGLRFRMGQVYQSMGRTVAAEAAYEYVVENDPRSIDGWMALAALQEQRDPFQARLSWSRALHLARQEVRQTSEPDDRTRVATILARLAGLPQVLDEASWAFLLRRARRAVLSEPPDQAPLPAGLASGPGADEPRDLFLSVFRRARRCITVWTTDPDWVVALDRAAILVRQDPALAQATPGDEIFIALDLRISPFFRVTAAAPGSAPEGFAPGRQGLMFRDGELDLGGPSEWAVRRRPYLLPHEARELGALTAADLLEALARGLARSVADVQDQLFSFETESRVLGPAAGEARERGAPIPLRAQRDPAAALSEALAEAGTWLVAQQAVGGRFRAGYRIPDARVETEGPEWWQAAGALALVALHEQDPRPAYLGAVRRSADHLGSGERLGALGGREAEFLREGPHAGMLGTALCCQIEARLVALDEARSASHRARALRLGRFLRALQAPDGSLHRYVPDLDGGAKLQEPPGEPPFQGDAILAFLALHELTGEAEWLSAAQRGLNKLIAAQRLGAPPDLRLALAAARLYELRGERALADQVLATARILLGEDRPSTWQAGGDGVDGLPEPVDDVARAGQVLLLADGLSRRIGGREPAFRRAAQQAAAACLAVQVGAADGYWVERLDAARGGFAASAHSATIRLAPHREVLEFLTAWQRSGP